MRAIRKNGSLCAEGGGGLTVLNEKEKSAFFDEINRGIVSHAYIIEGAPGVGKRGFAFAAAKAVLCTGTVKPCGVCSACKKCDGGNHPDLHVYAPDGNTFKVDLVRDIKRSVTLSPGEGEHSVYVLCDAHAMTASAQNALLKVFEEPPAGVVFFLLTEKREALLPTVRSRGRTIRLSAADDAAVRSFVKEKFPKVGEDELAEAVRMAGGSCGRAEAVLKKEGKTEREAALKLCGKIFSDCGRYELYTAFLGQNRKRETLLKTTDNLAGMARDVLVTKLECGTPTLLSPSQAASFADGMTVKSLYDILEALLECARSLRRNTDGGIALTELCRRITQGKG